MSKSAKALRKVFLERHKEWEASNNPQGIRSGKMQKKWERRMNSLMNLVHRKQEICTAPNGKLRIVHIDAHDHTPTCYGDYADETGVKSALKGMLYAQVMEMKVYNDQGKETSIAVIFKLIPLGS